MLGWLRRVIVGLLALVGLVVVVVAGGLYLLSAQLFEQYESRWQAPEMPPRVLLHLKLGGPLPEQETGTVQALVRRQHQSSLRQVLEALDRAAIDPRVGGILADLSHAQLGHAQAQELHQAILRFRSAGKPTIAFADTFGEGQSGNTAYYIASAFDHIWLQPSGDIGLTGISMEFMFLREALDELGIEPQMMRRQEYKGVVETLTERSLTLPVRENYRQIAESLYGRMIGDIAMRRDIAPERLRALVDTAPLNATAGLENRLVDRLGYRDEARAAALALAGGEARPIALGDYARTPPANAEAPSAQIALITVSGPIVRAAPDGLFREDMAAAGQLADALDAAVNTPSVRAILLRIDSPGGSYVASDSVWQAVRRAKESGKPVVAWMGNVAASGGYFIAMAADRIVAQPMTLTGSIGVAGGKIVFAGALDRLGIGHDRVAAGENAGLYSPLEPFTTAQRQQMERTLDRIYADFTGKAAAARGLDSAQIDRAARGRVFTGADAGEVGLVDAVGGYAEALQALRALLSLPDGAPLKLQPFPAPEDPFQAMLDLLRGGDFLQAMAGLSRLSALLTHYETMLGGAMEAPQPLRTPLPELR